MADVVEFYRGSSGITIPGQDGLWLPFPIEYKRGILKDRIEYRVQLCAQAICLEEMLQTQVPRGSLFYGKSKRRYDVEFDVGLRERTELAAEELHRLFDSGKTPPARYEKKCKSCSLLALCLPEAMERPKNTQAYLLREIDRAVLDQGTPP
jgi:CRISPR-associated exonuclease Cas4